MSKKPLIDMTQLDFEKGNIIFSYNTVSFNENLTDVNMKDYDTIKNIILSTIIEKNSTINIDIKNLTIPNSAVIGLITVISKVAILEYHKGLKIFFNSNINWQTKMIKNIFKNSGPCDIEDQNEKITKHSLINNYYSF